MTGSSAHDTQAIAIPSITLNDGNTLPAIGFGTYKLNGAAGVEVIDRAIAQGYHLIDSAFRYENEGAVGEAVRQTAVERASLRITTKLPGAKHAFDDATVTIEESLYRAGLDYFDLYLIHWPNPSKGLYVEAWKAMVAAQKRGLLRSIGVCNFLPEHIDNLIAQTGVCPSVNQIELHPYFPQHEQLAWNRAHGIATQSWSPLGRASDLLTDKHIGAIAERLGKSIPQVILRWHVQCGAIPLPKATSAERQRENASVFDFSLTDADLATIAALARAEGRLADQNPAYYEEF